MASFFLYPSLSISLGQMLIDSRYRVAAVSLSWTRGTRKLLLLLPVRYSKRARRGLQLNTCIVVEDVYTPDKVNEAVRVFGADDPAHPSVSYLRSRVKDFYVGGKVQAIKAPTHFDYVALRCKFHFHSSLCICSTDS